MLPTINDDFTGRCARPRSVRLDRPSPARRRSVALGYRHSETALRRHSTAIRSRRRPSGFGFEVEDHCNRRGAGFFDDGVHQESLTVGRHHVLLQFRTLHCTAHSCGEERNRGASFDRGTIGNEPDRNRHEPAIQRDVPADICSTSLRIATSSAALSRAAATPRPKHWSKKSSNSATASNGAASALFRTAHSRFAKPSPTGMPSAAGNSATHPLLTTKPAPAARSCAVPKKPLDCKIFGTVCTPENPMGSCMVSPEGSCAAYYLYGRWRDTPHLVAKQ